MGEIDKRGKQILITMNTIEEKLAFKKACIEANVYMSVVCRNWILNYLKKQGLLEKKKPEPTEV